jgi:hypothetical protein
MEVRLREGISDVGLELRLLTQRPLSPDAGRGAAERKGMQGGRAPFMRLGSSNKASSQK